MATVASARVFKNFINGEWVAPHGGKTYFNHNPANTQEILGEFPLSTQADVDAAVSSARQAYKTWRLLPAPKRAEILFRVAELLLKRKEEFASDMTREMGKILPETRGDVQEAIDMTYYMAGEGRRLFGQTTPSELPNKFAMSVRQPIGVCGMITPWNFPMAIPSWKMMPALVCGNTVVLKPAEDTPLSSYHLVETMMEAGIPPGVVNLVSGDGPGAGGPLASHKDTPVISFTGSTSTGRSIAQICAPEFKHCSLEMGGKNIILVLDDANLDLAVDGAIWGGFGTTGQRCTAASRIGVHKSIYKEFVSRFVERAQKLKIGNGFDAATEMGPVINQQQLHTVMNYVDIGKKEGAKLLTGGNRLDQGEYASGWFHQATVFGDCDPSMRIAREEIFGPVVSVIPIDSLEQGIDVANDVPYGLSASVYTRNVNAAFAALRDLYTGIVYINAPTIGAETHLPFGGTKQTGNGHREAAVAAIDFFTEWKSIYIDYSDKLQRAQIDNN
ncbi:MAG: aldehyde dehydrogenase family protein [Candidatus Acidiferrum sp.]